MRVLVVDVMVDITKDQGYICLALLHLNTHRTTRKVVPHHHHQENKSFHPSHGLGSLRSRRSNWNFFYTPNPSHGISSTSMKSNQNWIIIHFYLFFISLPLSTISNFLKWSPLTICDPLGRSHPDTGL